ncbi:MAG: formylglycine-generating enzyme family protein [Anaerolineales bacterium]|nr:formylglycine-generating enzyme family protein [Anaerolineales bacterium]
MIRKNIGKIIGIFFTAALIPIVAILADIFTPEIRQYVGLDITPTSIPAQVLTVMASQPPEPNPATEKTAIATTEVRTTPAEIPAHSSNFPVQIVDDYGVTMILIPAGEFQMGSDQGYNDERPVHTVYLDAYYMDAYEVTNGMYAECVKTKACNPPVEKTSYSRSFYYGNADYASYPVVNIDWVQARKYCTWRGARLPTEAEWEKAARGGLTGQEYTGGNNPPSCAQVNYGGVSGCQGDTQAVGSTDPNSFGLYEMLGNAWEWVWDWYSETYYNSSPAENPQGPAAGVYRVMRGGSWFSNDRKIRLAYRGWDLPETRGYQVGFRCAATP